jgi:hypothetical protein
MFKKLETYADNFADVSTAPVAVIALLEYAVDGFLI